MARDMFILYSAIIACLVNLVAIPVIIWIANRKKWFDEVNERKIHTGNISRLGGVGIFFSFAATLSLASLLFIRDARSMPWGETYWTIALSFVIIHFVGLIDDFRSLRARFRFGLQLGLAILVVTFGFRFKTIFIPFANVDFDLAWFSYPLTVFWIVGIINAVNLIDGLDGLCGGVSLIACCVYGIIYTEQGAIFPALTSFVLAGALAGYLFYNFPPAKIFMGDSGSTLLGFALAVLPLIGGVSEGTGISLWIAITIGTIPIFDTFAAILRRKRQGISFFSADKFHIHHKLLNLGFSNRQILAIVYASCMVLGSVAISSLYINTFANWCLVIISWLLFTVLFTILHYLKEKHVTFFGS